MADDRGAQSAANRNLRLLIHFAGGPAWSRQSKKPKRYAGKPAAYVGGCPPDAMQSPAVGEAIAAEKKHRLPKARLFTSAIRVFIVPDVVWGALPDRAGVLDAYIPAATKALEVRQRVVAGEGVELVFCGRCITNLENMRIADAKRVAAYKASGNWPPGSFQAAIKRSRSAGTKPGRMPIGVAVGPGVVLDRSSTSGGSGSIRERSGDELKRPPSAAIGWKDPSKSAIDPRQVRSDVRLAAAADRLARRVKADNRAKRKKAKR